MQSPFWANQELFPAPVSRSTPPVVYLILPCFNEEEMLPISAPQLLSRFQVWAQSGRIHPDSRLLFVDDGSRDQTWNLLSKLHDEHPSIACLRLSRNRGHQNALCAGLDCAVHKADLTISLDVDLQDDLESLEQMLDAYQQGYDVVYGVRRSRESDTVFKRGSAHLFYHLQQKLGAEVIFDHADYRLLSRRTLQALQQYPEVNLYLRGLVPLIGYPSTVVYSNRLPRQAGDSKYSLRAMLRLAGNGIIDYSSRLLNWIAPLGGILISLSLLLGIIALCSRAAGMPWSPLADLALLFTGLTGVLLLALGLVALYIGRIATEVKHRPRYFVQEYLP